MRADWKNVTVNSSHEREKRAHLHQKVVVVTQGHTNVANQRSVGCKNAFVADISGPTRFGSRSQVESVFSVEDRSSLGVDLSAGC